VQIVCRLRTARGTAKQRWTAIYSVTRRDATHYPPDARYFELISGEVTHEVTDGASREYQRNFSDHDRGRAVEIAQKTTKLVISFTCRCALRPYSIGLWDRRCEMNGISWTRGSLALLVAALIALGATGLLSVALAYPSPVVSALGPDWRCHRIVVVTSCTRLEQIQPVVDHVGKAATMQRGA
jgi:hypothetical protein